MSAQHIIPMWTIIRLKSGRWPRPPATIFARERCSPSMYSDAPSLAVRESGISWEKTASVGGAMVGHKLIKAFASKFFWEDGF